MIESYFLLRSGDKIPILLAFSFYSNGIKLLSYKATNSSEMMNCIHGIRVISTQWIVLGHTLSTYLTLPFRNQIALLEVIESCFHYYFIQWMGKFWVYSMCRNTAAWLFFLVILESIPFFYWVDCWRRLQCWNIFKKRNFFFKKSQILATIHIVFAKKVIVVEILHPGKADLTFR